MPILKYLRDLKSFSVLIIPDDTSHETRSKKFTLFRIIFIGLIYSIFVAVFGYYFFILTSIGSKVLPGNYVKSTEEIQKTQELNEKIIFLAKELQQLKSANQRLKYAIALGDSSLADTVDNSPDSLKEKYKNPKEGNLVGVIFEYLNQLFNQQDNSIFFVLPVNGYISRAFEPDKGHFGIDIVAKDGTPVYASAGGFVVFAGYTSDYGHVLILSHSNGYLSFYKHCALLLKKERDFVKQGELIAQSGNSGLATTGPHLHFEIWHYGTAIDPENLLLKNK